MKHNHPRKRVRRHLTVKRTPPGASPGTIAVDPAAPKPKIRVTAYGPEALVEEEVRDLKQLPKYLEKYPVTWVDVIGLGDARTLEELGKIFDLHPLALEDAVHADQRAKVEEYGDQLLFIIARLIKKDERLHSEQISLFVGKNFVISFQERSNDCFAPVGERLRIARGRIRQAGADYLAYALLDAVIDSFFPILEEFGERLERLDDDLNSRTAGRVISQIHDARSELILLRRTMWPHREAVNQLIRDPQRLLGDETRVFLRDCYDNIVQAIELVETYRELCADLRDECLSFVSNRLNEIMKVLTIIATIFMPLSFLASLYGMNFNTGASPWNMPELNWRFGYPFVLAIMVAAVVAMLFFFHRHGWMGKTDAAEEEAED
ncbi:MAG: magnesium/cobalt transporter CorA [Pirellulales bacterium]|nr:magnesium/cobalt transporter CorA [Pirellulales bacterium]